MRAVIIGSTGLVGSTLLKKLLEDPTFEKVTTVTRRKQSHDSSKLTQVLFEDFTELNQKRDELKGDVYFCCLGTTIKKAKTKENFLKVDHDGVIEFAKVAKENGAKSFTVVSASGANKASKIFYNRVKGQTEEDLKELNFDNLIIARPSLLIGDRNEDRPLEEIAIKTYGLLKSILPDSLRARAGTDVEILAEVLKEESIKARKGVQVLEAKNISRRA